MCCLVIHLCEYSWRCRHKLIRRFWKKAQAQRSDEDATISYIRRFNSNNNIKTAVTATSVGRYHLWIGSCSVSAASSALDSLHATGTHRALSHTLTQQLAIFRIAANGGHCRRCCRRCRVQIRFSSNQFLLASHLSKYSICHRSIGD